jgi:U3 small nucleolar RNA-associated protein 4
LISSAISDDGRFIAISDLYETKLFLLSNTRPIRIKSFLNTLATSQHTQHLEIGTKGLGSSILTFTPDSRRLIMGHVQTGSVIIIELPTPSPSSKQVEEVSVVKSFNMGGNTIHGRSIMGLTRRQKRSAAHREAKGLNGDSSATVNGNGNGNGNEEEDEDMDIAPEDNSNSSSHESKNGNWISCLCASEDGQWLVSSDVGGRVTVFNLDTLQVSHASFALGIWVRARQSE